MKLSFRTKILLPVVSVIVFSFLVTGFITYNSSKKEVTDLATEQAWGLVIATADIVKNTFIDSLSILDSLGDGAGFLSSREPDNQEFAAYLTALAKRDPNIYSIYIIWEDNSFAPMVVNDNGNYTFGSIINIHDQWYTNVLSSRSTRALISEDRVVTRGNSKSNVISLNKFFESSGRRGIVGVDILTSRVYEPVQNIKVYETGYAFLLSRDLIFLSHPLTDLVGTRLSYADDIRQYTERHERHSFLSNSVVTGKVVENFYAPVVFRNTDAYFYVALTIPQEEMLAGVINIRNAVIIVATIAIFFTFIVIFLIVRNLLRQLGGEPTYVIEKVNEIADGNFATDIKLARNDSSSLVFYIKSMAANLRGTIAANIEAANNLSDASGTLSSGASELAAGMTEQASRTEQISSASIEMNATTSEIAGSLDNMVVFTNQVDNKVNEGTSAVADALQEIVKIQQTADAASTQVRGLEGTSSEIRNIIETITAIADQTNLLALNAAIEAARAGEAGRGFAVVADEVRKLAEKTQASTNEISTLVQNIQNEISNVTKSMTNVNVQVERGVNASSGITGILGEIKSVVEHLKDMVSSISGSTQEMSATSEQIQHDISEVATVSNQVSTTTEGLAKNAVKLEHISIALKDMIARFKI